MKNVRYAYSFNLSEPRGTSYPLPIWSYEVPPNMTQMYFLKQAHTTVMFLSVDSEKLEEQSDLGFNYLHKHAHLNVYLLKSQHNIYMYCIFWIFIDTLSKQCRLWSNYSSNW